MKEQAFAMSTKLRVCLLQTNPLVGDVVHNLSQIRRAIERDPARADLFVTPELALVGYTPRDLLSLPSLIELSQNWDTSRTSTRSESW